MTTVEHSGEPQSAASLAPRSIAERLSRGVILKRSLRTPHGKRRLVVTPEARLRYWLPGSLNNDAPLCEFAERHIHAGQKVWDIGANVGVFTFLAASLCTSAGSVLAVEADPFLASLLHRSVKLTPATDARPDILTAAIADRIAIAPFAISARSRASNFLVSDSIGCSQTGGIRGTHNVVCVTLDWLHENTFAPDLVKMDIEGLELKALSAAPRLLQEVRPVLHLEVWESIADKLSSLLAQHEYMLFDGEADLALAKPIQRAVWTTVCVPREKFHSP